MQINDLTNDIELVWSSSEKETIPKLGLRTRILNDLVHLILPAGGWHAAKSQADIVIDYNDVTSPVVTTAEGLRDIILTYTASVSQDTVVGNPDYAHYTAVENIDESNLGIDATHAGAVSGTVFDDNASTFTAETVAEGYTVYNITDGCSAVISADTLLGLAGDGGAGTPAADSITSAALAGGAGNNWQVADVASIPEVKRTEVSVESYKYFSIDVLLDSQNANNSLYCKIYFTNDADADDTDDTYWKDMSTEVFGAAAGVVADGIGSAARVVTQGIYFIDTATIGLKLKIKVVAENNDGTQDNEVKVRIKKGY